jgi:hypothetical protein
MRPHAAEAHQAADTTRYGNTNPMNKSNMPTKLWWLPQGMTQPWHDTAHVLQISAACPAGSRRLAAASSGSVLQGHHGLHQRVARRQMLANANIRKPNQPFNKPSWPYDSPAVGNRRIVSVHDLQTTVQAHTLQLPAWAKLGQLGPHPRHSSRKRAPSRSP